MNRTVHHLQVDRNAIGTSATIRFAPTRRAQRSKATLVAAAIISGLTSAGLVVQAQDKRPPSAAERMLRPGPDRAMLERQVGRWDAVATLWPSPAAKPIITKGLIAERTMVGTILQEILRPAPGSGIADFQRIDYLDFDRVEGRWKYVSLDTRFPVSIMPAWSFGTERARIVLLFEPQAFVGFGAEVEGRLLRSDLVITQPSPDRVVKEQHVIMATGTGERWLFTRYEYTRRP
jgi:hypothetical protein